MQSWPAPPLPTLPGSPGPLRLHDSARGLVEVAPVGTARLYVCGITPYDATHLGHAATYVAFDTLVRFWRDAGLTVEYVQNVTDIDDPLLERAARDGQDWTAVAQRETALFREDMAALRVLPPSSYVGAVEAMDEISAMVVRLLEAGAAYRVDEDLYFPVSSAAHFGSVSGLPREAMLVLAAERGGDPERPGKKDALDPLLWRAERPGEPAWDSPLGRGRPGWHVECTAIGTNRLGPRVDVVGGGSDLVFPHHELSAAHAEVVTGQAPYATASVHAGMIGLDGEKMSKSRGNLVFVSTLRRAGVVMAALRLALLSHHYRADREWTDAMLGAAQARLGRWRAAVSRPAGPSGQDLLHNVRAALGDDLNTPGALAALDRWSEADGADADAPRLVADVADALLGVPLLPAPG